MKHFNWLFTSGLLGIVLIAICCGSCKIDSTDFSIQDKDVYIDSVIIEASKNNFLTENIKASVTNHARTIIASLPSSAKDKEVVLTIFLQEGIQTDVVSGTAIHTGNSLLKVFGFGLKEEYTVDLKVLKPFESDKEFVSVWKANANEKITLPLIPSGNYNFQVFWGDGQSNIVAAYDIQSASHIYAAAGDYTVKVWGQIDGFNFDLTKTSAKNILDIKDWGRLKLGNDGGYFRACANLQITAVNAPDLSETTSLRAMFREATSFNSNINHWDVSKVTTMWDTFYLASNFNQPLDKWDVHSVTTFETMFNTSAFNQNISGWNVSKVVSMKNMFRDCPFNQPIGNWDVSSVTDFQSTFRANNSFNQDLSGWGKKLGKVVNMREMFRESAYNRDLSAWDVSNVVTMWDMFNNSGFNNPSIANWKLNNLDNMETMFGGELCKFNQNISAWNVGNVVNMQNLFKGNLVFNQDLSSWNVTNVKCNLDYDTGAPQWNNANKPKFTPDKTGNTSFCTRPI